MLRPTNQARNEQSATLCSTIESIPAKVNGIAFEASPQAILQMEFALDLFDGIKGKNQKITWPTADGATCRLAEYELREVIESLKRISVSRYLKARTITSQQLPPIETSALIDRLIHEEQSK